MRFTDDGFWVNTLGAALEDWELLVRDICLGFLISGLFLFLMTVFFQGMHLFDHDTDIGADHDLSADHDVGIDHDVGLDHDVGIDHDLGGDYGTPAPLLLLAATFMLIAGALGTSLYSLEDQIDSYARFAVVVAIPVFCTFLVSWAWRKLATSSLVELEIEGVQANDDVVALTNVDEDGGLVRAKYTSSEGITGHMKLPAKTLPGVVILKGVTAFVIDKQGSTLLIDEWPNPPQKGESK